MKAISNKAKSKPIISQPSDFSVDYVCQQIERTGFVHITNLLTEKLLRALYNEIKHLNENFELENAGIGRGNDHIIEKSVRKDKIHWIEGKTLAQCLLNEQLENLRISINERLMLGLFDFESHYAIYRQGDFYKKHRDSFKGQKNRILSMVIYLNPTWEESDGGLLNIYNNKRNKPFLSVIPKWGNVVLFLSEDTPHEVTPTNKNRYSIATWFRCNQLTSSRINL